MNIESYSVAASPHLYCSLTPLNTEYYIAWPPHLHPFAGIGEDDTESETGFLIVEVIDNGYFDGLGGLPFLRLNRFIIGGEINRQNRQC